MSNAPLQCPGCGEQRLIEVVDAKRGVAVCSVCSRQWKVQQ